MSFLIRHGPDGRCAACGAANAACGDASSDVVPADQLIEEVAAVGGPLKKYNVVTPTGHKTVIKYNEADADRAGLTDADLVDEPGPAGAAGAVEVVEAKIRPVSANTGRSGSANKARTPSAAKGGRKAPAAKAQSKAAADPGGADVPPAETPGDGTATQQSDDPDAGAGAPSGNDDGGSGGDD